MKYPLILFLCLSLSAYSQTENEPSTDFPYGKAHPDAPKQIKDFQPLIGSCNCKSTARNKDGSWAESQNMVWNWKYIMNGNAVQDETLKEDGAHSGSIRQYIADSSKWYVHYYSSKNPTTTLSTWEGNKTEDNKIVLYRKQKAPNGMEGFYRLTFYDINSSGYKWIGEWVDKTEKTVYPTWKIECKRADKTKSDIDIIKENTIAFSKAYMEGDIDALANKYTDDGKIFPNNINIISSKESIKKYWMLPEGVKIISHKVTPTEIKVEGNYAYDYGYYEGKTRTQENEEVSWKGKYVIVWKKTGDDWKIFLDIWNKVN
ncbi:DUF4440 domain-containing protein [Olleya sp. YS]|uniref:YybH family protein n=1 Tax=Olleya sp. YS TaxID=3028318 RepID=UPI0024345DB7|nr:DUF4440 domain-containing protein [Olleya sp. YS]WGD33818.1 DUF4440 domain-containing protein [Olleya sp. YS]